MAAGRARESAWPTVAMDDALRKGQRHSEMRDET